MASFYLFVAGLIDAGILFFVFSYAITRNSPIKVMSRPNYLDYYSKMFSTTIKAFPRRVYSFFGCVFIANVLLYFFVSYFVRDGHIIVWLDAPNAGLLIVGISSLVKAQKHEPVTEKWKHMRIIVHKRAYKKTPRLGKYASFREMFGFEPRKRH